MRTLVLLALSFLLAILTGTGITAQKITGQVLTPEGKPMVGVRLELVEDTMRGAHHSPHSRGAEPLVGKSGADGRFELTAADMVPLVGYSLFVVTDEYEDIRIADLTRPDRTRDLGKIELRRGARVSGLVLDDDQKPVPGATVRWFPEQGWYAALELAPSRYFGWEASTDPKGRFVLRNLPAERGIVYAAKADFATDSRPTLARADKAWNTQLVLFPKPGQRGVIRDPDGKPVAGAMLYMIPGHTSHKTPVAVARTNEKGEYVMHVPSYPGLHQVVRARGWFDTYVTNSLFGGLRRDGQFTAWKYVKVRVKTPDGKTLDRFAARFSHADLRPPHFTVVDTEKGIGKLAWIRPGRYRVEARVPGYAPSFSSIHLLGYPSREPVPDVFEVVLRKGPSLRGRFLDATGKPCANMPIELHAGREMQNRKIKADFLSTNGTRTPARTDESGRFEVENLANLPYTVVARRDDHVLSVTNVELKGADVSLGDVRLIRSVQVSGTFTYRGKTMAGVSIRLSSQSSGPGRLRGILEATTDKAGRFEFAERVPPGRYLVAPVDSRVKVKRRPGDMPKTITIEPGQTEFAFPFDLR